MAPGGNMGPVGQDMLRRQALGNPSPTFGGGMQYDPSRGGAPGSVMTPGGNMSGEQAKPPVLPRADGGPSPEFGGGMGVKPLGAPAVPSQGAGQWVDAGFGEGPLNGLGQQWQAAAPAQPSSPMPPSIGGGGYVGGNMNPAQNKGVPATRGMSPAAGAEQAMLKRAGMQAMPPQVQPQPAMPAAQLAQPKPAAPATGAARRGAARRPAPVPSVTPKPVA